MSKSTLKQINLEKSWDKNKICNNPHKGWYIHFYDNCITKYGDRLAEGDFLEDFPGLNHIYLRLAWSYLEPEEGKYNWEIIDKVINQWTSKGYTISFRISCKETDKNNLFATPKWVIDAGARGQFTQASWSDSIDGWEPDYGDPVFLEKLENFIKAFAGRYDNKNMVEYVDIGSYGDWGEGHTASSSLKDWPVEVIKKHIDIHLAHFKNTVLAISDDIVGSREQYDGSREEILEYIVSKGITLRDDGISVKWFADRFGKSTMRNPEYFDRVWLNKPTILELEHYEPTVRNNTWKNGEPFIASAEEIHATFAGFHGYPREWLSENPEVAAYMANRLGYWYFIKSVEVISNWSRGTTQFVKLVWENHGYAPAYHKYRLFMKFACEKDNSATFQQECIEADNKAWMPGRIIGERYAVKVPENIKAGRYKILVKLVEMTETVNRNVELGLSDSIKESEGYYCIAETFIE
jgi:hypothetical protein